MQATQKPADAKAGHQYGEESPHHVGMEDAGTAQKGDTVAMEGRSIDQEGNQRPGLFGVPCPITAPRLVGPDRSDKDARPQQEDRGKQQQAAEQHQPVPPARTTQGQHTVQAKEGRQGIAHHDQ